MNDVPQGEAIALLSETSICPDVPTWSVTKLKPGLAIVECGLIRNDGSRSGLQLQLQFSRSPKTRIVTFKFTVFRASLGGLQRVYQLQVNAVARAPKNAHDLVHEHMGNARLTGDPEWLKWGFAEALDYFCHRTNIIFLPPVLDPEHFELTP